MEEERIEDLESERAVLGCILAKNDVIETALEFIHESDFSQDINSQIFSTMELMYGDNELIEPLSLHQKIKDRFSNDANGYLAKLKTEAPNPDNLEFYAQRVVNASTKRQAIDMLNEAQKEIAVSDEPISKVAEFLGRMENIRSASVDKSVFTIQDLYAMRADYLDKKQAGEIAEEVLPTGLKDLDQLLNGGLRFRHFDVLAARPAMGKTSLAVQIALNASLKENVRSLIISIEMSKEDIMDKMTSVATKIPYRKINMGDLSQDDWDRMTEFAMKIAPRGGEEPQVLVDDTSKDLNRVISIIRRCVRKNNVRFVVIDYLQLLNINGKFNTRDEQLGYAVNLLAYTAKTLNINILALSQLNRGVESREGKRPGLSDLRESGNIEQAAWRVLSIYRDEYYNADSAEVGVAELQVLKGKISNTGKVQVYFDKECTRFDNLQLSYKQ